MTSAARHHYVPQFHLRAWGHGDGRGRLWVYDKTTDSITKRSVKGVAFQPDYYRVRTSTGGTHDDLEGLFGRIESAAAPFIKHFADMPPGPHVISAEARDAMAGYMAVLHARVPAQRDIVRGLGQLCH